VLVGEVAAADQGNLALEPGVLVLAGEAQRVVAGAGEVDRVHIALESGDVRREVGRSERRPELLHDLAARFLERALERGAALVAERPVLADHRDLLVLHRVVGVLAERMPGLAGRPPGADDVRAPAPLREVFAGDGR
jgi:hypothetical protein